VSVSDGRAGVHRPWMRCTSIRSWGVFEEKEEDRISMVIRVDDAFMEMHLVPVQQEYKRPVLDMQVEW